MNKKASKSGVGRKRKMESESNSLEADLSSQGGENSTDREIRKPVKSQKVTANQCNRKTRAKVEENAAFNDEESEDYLEASSSDEDFEYAEKEGDGNEEEQSKEEDEESDDQDEEETSDDQIKEEQSEEDEESDDQDEEEGGSAGIPKEQKDCLNVKQDSTSTAKHESAMPQNDPESFKKNNQIFQNSVATPSRLSKGSVYALNSSPEWPSVKNYSSPGTSEKQCTGSEKGNMKKDEGYDGTLVAEESECKVECNWRLECLKKNTILSQYQSIVFYLSFLPLYPLFFQCLVHQNQYFFKIIITLNMLNVALNNEKDEIRLSISSTLLDSNGQFLLSNDINTNLLDRHVELLLFQKNIFVTLISELIDNGFSIKIDILKHLSSAQSPVARAYPRLSYISKSCIPSAFTAAKSPHPPSHGSKSDSCFGLTEAKPAKLNENAPSQIERKLEEKQAQIKKNPLHLLRLVREQQNLLLNNPSKKPSSSLESLVRDLKEFLDEGLLSDVKMNVGGKTFNVHKVILARSPVFRRMMNNEWSESNTNQINITDCDSGVFQKFLKYLYTADIGYNDLNTMMSLYSLSDRYYIKDLQNICSHRLQSLFDSDIVAIQIKSVCKILRLAHYHSDMILKDLAVQFMTKHYSKVGEREEWRDIIKEDPNLASEVLFAIHAVLMK